MKVGDLVVFVDTRDTSAESPDLGAGIVVSFDPDGDPIISFHGYANENPSPFYRQDIEVLNESR